MRCDRLSKTLSVPAEDLATHQTCHPEEGVLGPTKDPTLPASPPPQQSIPTTNREGHDFSRAITPRFCFQALATEGRLINSYTSDAPVLNIQGTRSTPGRGPAAEPHDPTQFSRQAHSHAPG